MLHICVNRWDGFIHKINIQENVVYTSKEYDLKMKIVLIILAIILSGIVLKH